MPHDTRHFKPQRKKPKRSRPLGISDPELLLLHRELAALRIAGGAKPGAHRDALIAERFSKLDASEAVASVTEVTCPTKAGKSKRFRCSPENAVRKINDMPSDRRLDAMKDFLTQQA